LHPIPGVGLAEDSSDVSLDGALTEEQALRDFGVGQALGDEAEDVDLPSGQALQCWTVKDASTPAGYRDQFGPAWTDVEMNGCDTRNDILAGLRPQVDPSLRDPSCRRIMPFPWSGPTGSPVAEWVWCGRHVADDGGV